MNFLPSYSFNKETGIGTSDPGVLGIGMGLFDTYNKWQSADELMDLQKDAFNFSKDKFWNNFLMQRDAYNRELNRREGFRNASSIVNDQGRALTPEEWEANRNINRTGSGVVNPDGSQYNVTNVPGQYMGQGYSQNTYQNLQGQPVAPNPQQQTSPTPTIQSTNPNASVNTAAVTPRPATIRNSAFNKRKIGV